MRRTRAPNCSSNCGCTNRERAIDFAGSELMPGVTRSVIQERDRIPLQGAAAGAGFRMMVDVMSEFGSRARVATWRLDITRTGAPGSDTEWTIADQEKIVELLDDPVRRAQMGKFGRRRVMDELEWSYEVPKLLAAYAALSRPSAVSAPALKTTRGDTPI